DYSCLIWHSDAWVF
nr:immunoglobulin light chain junction region [Macaca mulatta]MOX82352.1 immunoglobulin light chain junction region [Macaca mulatta]